MPKHLSFSPLKKGQSDHERTKTERRAGKSAAFFAASARRAQLAPADRTSAAPATESYNDAREVGECICATGSAAASHRSAITADGASDCASASVVVGGRAAPTGAADRSVTSGRWEGAVSAAALVDVAHSGASGSADAASSLREPSRAVRAAEAEPEASAGDSVAAPAAVSTPRGPTIGTKRLRSLLDAAAVARDDSDSESSATSPSADEQAAAPASVSTAMVRYTVTDTVTRFFNTWRSMGSSDSAELRYTAIRANLWLRPMLASVSVQRQLLDGDSDSIVLAAAERHGGMHMVAAGFIWTGQYLAAAADCRDRLRPVEWADCIAACLELHGSDSALVEQAFCALRAVRMGGIQLGTVCTLVAALHKHKHVAGIASVGPQVIAAAVSRATLKNMMRLCANQPLGTTSAAIACLQGVRDGIYDDAVILPACKMLSALSYFSQPLRARLVRAGAVECLMTAIDRSSGLSHWAAVLVSAFTALSNLCDDVEGVFKVLLDRGYFDYAEGILRDHPDDRALAVAGNSFLARLPRAKRVADKLEGSAPGSHSAAACGGEGAAVPVPSERAGFAAFAGDAAAAGFAPTGPHAADAADTSTSLAGNATARASATAQAAVAEDARSLLGKLRGVLGSAHAAWLGECSAAKICAALHKHAEDADVVEAALGALAHLAAMPAERDALMGLGAGLAAIRCMSTHKGRPIALAGSQLLARLCSDEVTADVRALHESGADRVLLTCLRRHGSHLAVAQAACEAIAHLVRCSESDGRGQLLKLGASDKLLHCLDVHLGDKELVRSVCSTVSIMAETSAGAMDLQRHAAAEHVVRALSSHGVDILSEAGRALGKLAAGCTGKCSFPHEKAAEALCSYLQSDDPRAAGTACFALYRLVAASAEVQLCMTGDAKLADVLKVLERHSASAVAVHVASMLLSLLAARHATMTAALALTVVGAVVKALLAHASAPSETAAEQACLVVSNLAASKVEVTSTALCEAGAVTLVVDRLRAYADVRVVATRACRALRILSDTPATRPGIRAAGAEAAVEEVLRRGKHSADVKFVEQAKAFLSTMKLLSAAPLAAAAAASPGMGAP